jgi:LysM repeat protein
VDRICPFLALSDDHRTAIDGYDPDHACHARRPPEPLDRARQTELCLVEAHRKCEYYVAYLSEHATVAAAAFPMPASDTNVARTRLVFEPDARRLRTAPRAAFGTSPGRWLIAGGIAAIGVAAAATAAAGGFNGLVGMPGPSASPAQASVNPTTTTASPTPVPTAEPTPAPTPAPTQAPATSAPTTSPKPQGTPAATPEPRTYVVQEGDTLSLIANRFGTSVSALQAANGIDDPDEIRPGQVLVIR